MNQPLDPYLPPQAETADPYATPQDALVNAGRWRRLGTYVIDYFAFTQVLGRTFARFIPFEPFSLLFGSERLGWHDSLPHTRVVLAPGRG